MSLCHSTQSCKRSFLQENFRLIRNASNVFINFSLILVWNSLNELRQGVVWNVLFDKLQNVTLAAQTSVVVTASQDELRRHLVFVTSVVFYPFSLNIVHLNLNSLAQEFERIVILVFFEVNAAKIIHA